MNLRAPKSQVLPTGIFVLCGVASAQDAFLARWQALRSREPEGVSFLISAAKTDFYAGELVPLQLSFVPRGNPFGRPWNTFIPGGRAAKNNSMSQLDRRVYSSSAGAIDCGASAVAARA